jgi:hypothetical protein
MAQTFDIRFERTGGVASFFAAAENAFRWKGAGRLSIDPHGIRIAARRGLTSLFTRRSSHSIAAADLREVYREGAALRMEFGSSDDGRVVLPFWAPDRDTAAEIVRLLPTTRTIELEHVASNPQRGKFRLDRVSLVIAALGLVVIAGVAWKLAERPGTAPAVASPIAMPKADKRVAIEPAVVAIPVDLPDLPEVPLSALATDADHLSLDIRPGSPAFTAAQRFTADFEQQARAIEADYRIARQMLLDKKMSSAEFAVLLDGYVLRWWDVTFKILDNNALAGADLLDLRAGMLGIARHWRNFLDEYADGLRESNHLKIAHSFDSLTRAEEMRARLRTLMR